MRPLSLARSRRSLFGRAATALFSMALASASVLATAQTKAETLRIGYQKGASLFVLQKAQGTLEKRLAPLNVDVRWVEFPAGPQLLEGLNVGSVDVGFVGEAPPIFAQAAGANFVYIGNDPASPQAESKRLRRKLPDASLSSAIEATGNFRRSCFDSACSVMAQNS